MIQKSEMIHLIRKLHSIESPRDGFMADLRELNLTRLCGGGGGIDAINGGNGSG